MIDKPLAAPPTYLQSKFTLLWQAKDYDLLVGKTVGAAHPRLNIANLITKVRSKEINTLFAMPAMTKVSTFP